jgi:hypothetical protein
MLIVGALAAGDNKDAPKSKRAYSLGYGYEPFAYNHDVIAHAPVTAPVAVHPAPVASTFVHHEPVVAHAPIVSHAPLYSHAAVVSAPVLSKSVISTNIHHYPASYYAAAHAPLVSSAYVAHHPVVSSPLVAEFHRR